MKTKVLTGFYDKNGTEIRTGDLVYYTESPERYADNMSLIIEHEGRFCQAPLVCNSACSNLHIKYIPLSIKDAVKNCTNMIYNNRLRDTDQLLDTEILDSEKNGLDINNIDFLVQFMSENYPL